MKKIIHLSDLHIGYKNLSQVFEDMVERIILNKIPASNYVIVITGDIVDDATEDNIYKKAIKHLDKLKTAGFEVLVVPGNHDLGTGGIGNRKYVKRFKKSFFGNENLHYPKLDIIDNIAFFGLDSMEEELNWYDFAFAQGELGEKQLDKLKALLNTTEVKNCDYRVVYLHHHPLDPKPFMQLRDSDELKKILKNSNISALLFGHNHDGKNWNGSGAWGINRVYDAGSSTGKSPEKDHPHRVISLDKEPDSDYDGKF